MAQAMAAALAEYDVPSAAEVSGRLRRAFPLAPLGARLTALGLVMERSLRAS
jgi:hypothetical protein